MRPTALLSIALGVVAVGGCALLVGVNDYGDGSGDGGGGGGGGFQPRDAPSDDGGGSDGGDDGGWVAVELFEGRDAAPPCDPGFGPSPTFVGGAGASVTCACSCAATLGTCPESPLVTFYGGTDCTSMLCGIGGIRLDPTCTMNTPCNPSRVRYDDQPEGGTCTPIDDASVDFACLSVACAGTAPIPGSGALKCLMHAGAMKCPDGTHPHTAFQTKPSGATCGCTCSGGGHCAMVLAYDVNTANCSSRKPLSTGACTMFDPQATNVAGWEAGAVQDCNAVQGAMDASSPTGEFTFCCDR